MMEPASVEGKFNEDQKNISPGISRLNREEQIREMNSPHQDPSLIQKSAISIVPITQNQEATFELIAIESPELRTQIQSTSFQIRRDLTAGVSSPNDLVPLSQILKQTNSRIADGENSGDVVASNAEINGSLLKELDSQEKTYT